MAVGAAFVPQTEFTFGDIFANAFMRLAGLRESQRQFNKNYALSQRQLASLEELRRAQAMGEEARAKLLREQAITEGALRAERQANLRAQTEATKANTALRAFELDRAQFWDRISRGFASYLGSVFGYGGPMTPEMADLYSNIYLRGLAADKMNIPLAALLGIESMLDYELFRKIFPGRLEGLEGSEDENPLSPMSTARPSEERSGISSTPVDATGVRLPISIELQKELSSRPGVALRDFLRYLSGGG